MKSIKVITINVRDKVEAWATTKAAVIAAAEAAAKAFAKAHQIIADRCGQQADSIIRVKKGAVACDICAGFAQITINHPHFGVAITANTARKHWRGSIKAWQALARALVRYSSVEYCYRVLAERL